MMKEEGGLHTVKLLVHVAVAQLTKEEGDLSPQAGPDASAANLGGEGINTVPHPLLPHILRAQLHLRTREARVARPCPPEALRLAIEFIIN
jgi:hypothetical protein